MRINQWNGGKYNINENYFDEIDSPEKARLLGFLFSDGNNYLKEYKLTINVSRSRRSMLENICQMLETDKPIKDYNVNEKYMSSRLVIKNKKISTRLNDLGIVPAKSLCVQYPEWICSDLERHFIAGVWDGDGIMSIPSNKSYNPVIGFCGNPDFINKINNILYRECEISFSKNISNNILHIRTGSVYNLLKLDEYMHGANFGDPVKLEKLKIAKKQIGEKYANRKYSRKTRS